MYYASCIMYHAHVHIRYGGAHQGVEEGGETSESRAHQCNSLLVFVVVLVSVLILVSFLRSSSRSAGREGGGGLKHEGGEGAQHGIRAWREPGRFEDLSAMFSNTWRGF